MRDLEASGFNSETKNMEKKWITSYVAGGLLVQLAVIFCISVFFVDSSNRLTTSASGSSDLEYASHGRSLLSEIVGSDSLDVEGGDGGERHRQGGEDEDEENYFPGGKKRKKYKDDFLSDLKKVDFETVREELVALFTDSKEEWPADYGHYGPLYVRLAWHCAGSYRIFDGRGGCDGSRIRQEPERSWDDNANLNYAVDLLRNIKEKHSISWGDLIILAGNTAIEDMGGPKIGFCPGRQDDLHGAASLFLGPGAEQDSYFPCEDIGNCDHATQYFAAVRPGLIYVDPAGPKGDPTDFQGSVEDIRRTFSRMGMNDTETVALIGGGHAFGKTHGACPAGPSGEPAQGEKPKDNPVHPYQGICGRGKMMGKGINTVTSGFEGPWTSTPTKWSNMYFRMLQNLEYKLDSSPHGNPQYSVDEDKSGASPRSISVDGSGTEKVMMLTTDIALSKVGQDAAYISLVEEFSSDISKLDEEFAAAWYKLTTRDMGPYSRCFPIPSLLKPQPFQFPLPEPDQEQISLIPYPRVANRIKKEVLLTEEDSKWMVTYAYQCALTFRSTDYLGGCDGARIRFEPEKGWSVNAGLEKVAMEKLKSIKEFFGESLSWADLITLAGTVGMRVLFDDSDAHRMKFCPGRTDLVEYDGGSDYLRPVIDGEFTNTIEMLREHMLRSGLTTREYVVLMGRPRSKEQQIEMGYEGSYGDNNLIGGKKNQYFTTLVEENWVEYRSQAGKMQYKADGGSNKFILKSDHLLLEAEDLRKIVDDFAYAENAFMSEFAAAWTKMMNNDRFDGPSGNLCN
mmetsp:Transcript_11813/g.16000  ORF Transcript_11813/g.16000 Transcript_11813/m.16000 type:complete len:793 (+) Transcript_11813:245-2623(+)|eukprot:CAMPEP_0196584020 /NCGR_PEP_ID=MMETSP1081-20130531/45482_1 /TAXON_ID=36882 /ORGANISM="Pyramimonas amylifera, Strain CCMP720" /LENGTH=792 /DNA_ID=CAMNT_0041905091 /DNA_START=235 /DNA_END=2613 /DNA_ORIENTATION=-